MTDRLDIGDKLLRQIADNYPNACVSVIERDLTVGFTGGQGCRSEPPMGSSLVGLSPSQIYGELAAFVSEQYRRTFAGESLCFELPLQEQRKLVHTAPLREKDGDIERILTVTEDVTERMREEETLRESERRFHAMFDRHDAVMLLVDPGSGRIVDANQAAERFYGYDKASLADMTIEQINVLPPDRVALERGKALREEQNFFHFEHRLANGELRHVEVHSSPIVYGDEMILFSIVHDVTERKRAEAEKLRLERQLYRSRRMEAIGRLAGGVAHDFNNLITVIRCNTSVALARNGNDALASELLTEVEAACRRAGDLTRQLLAFSRAQHVDPKVVGPNQLLRDIGKLLTRILGEDIEFVWQLEELGWNIRVDPGQIEQVLLNMAANARAAMSKGGTLTLATRALRVDDVRCDACGEPIAGSYVVIEMRDTGCGMDRETQAKVFEPFFTTHPDGLGTGLGLASAFGVVHQHEGHITVHSRLGQGSEFALYLPAVEQPAESATARGSAREVPKGRGEVILVVEDDASVRSAAARALSFHGYEVVEAGSGAEAITQLDAHPRAPALLLTDIVMPGMSGRELAERLVSIHPTLKVLYTSGYPEGRLAEDGREEPPVPCIAKPYKVADLMRHIRRLLAGS